MVLAAIVACLMWPVPGPVVEHFAPEGRFGGHWGIDLAVEVGTTVQAPASGTVTFAGSVAGMRTVSIDLDSGLRVSLSYLSEISVGGGDRVRRGDPVGSSGIAHGHPALHLSTRVDGTYVDPVRFFACAFDVRRGLWLLEPVVRPR